MEGFVPDVLEGEISIHEFSSANLQKSLILPTIDAVLWREETERVTSLLRLAWKEKNKGEMGWVANIETLKHYSSQTKSREGDDDVDISTLSLIEMISMLQKTLLENLSGIIRNETFLNSDSTFSSLAVEYAGLHEVFCHYYLQ